MDGACSLQTILQRLSLTAVLKSRINKRQHSKDLSAYCFLNRSVFWFSDQIYFLVYYGVLFFSVTLVNGCRHVCTFAFAIDLTGIIFWPLFLRVGLAGLIRLQIQD